MRRDVRRGGSPMVLRSGEKMGVRGVTVKIGSRAGASAWIVGGAKIFCWLFATRSTTQEEVAVGGQVCAVMPFDDLCIAWQWVIAAAVLLAR
jgi:hypothetical protein